MEEKSLRSMSSKPLVVNQGEFIKKLRGVLGADLKLQESKTLKKFSIDSVKVKVLQNPRRTFRKKRTPRFDASVADDKDGPSTSEEVFSAAISLQLLRQDKTFMISPQFSWKEENLVSAFPQNFSQGFSKRKKESLKKPTSGTEEDNIERNTRAVKKVRRSLIPVLGNLGPELPMNFKIQIREITGSGELGSVVFVYEKTLFKSDVSSGQNRFLIPVKQLKNEFLTEKEKELLRTTSDEITGKASIEALLIQPSLEKCKINLRKWDMGGKSKGNFTENYVLVTTWNKVVKDNKMVEGMTVQLWSFRRGDDLCFALVNRG